MYGKHYVIFPSNISSKLRGRKLNRDNWQMLRECRGDYALSCDKKKYLKKVRKMNNDYNKRVKIIIQMIRKSHCKRVVSLGSGCGYLEFLIKENMPGVHITCTDYTDKAITMLQQVSNCDDFKVFNIVNGKYDTLGGKKDVCLLIHRVSTEFDFNRWLQILEKIYNAHNIKYLIFVPAEHAKPVDIIREFFFHKKNQVSGIKDIDCGWLYTKKTVVDYLTLKGKKKHAIQMIVPVDDTAIYYVRTN